MSINAQKVAKYLSAMPRANQLKERFQSASAITDKWGLLRQIYMEKMPEIWEASELDPLGQTDPYFVDWAVKFTPIEKLAWHSIRSQGVPLYPQFPLFNHFVDFANPFHRVGLELDGKEWHDEKKDRERDQKFAEFGWRIFRVPGREAMAQFEEPGEIAERGGTKQDQKIALEHWLLNTCDGVVASIDRVCFRKEADAYDGIAFRSLVAHRLADFDILIP